MQLLLLWCKHTHLQEHNHLDTPPVTPALATAMLHRLASLRKDSSMQACVSGFHQQAGAPAEELSILLTAQPTSCSSQSYHGVAKSTPCFVVGSRMVARCKLEGVKTDHTVELLMQNQACHAEPDRIGTK